jgi:methionine-gamma-lyase
MSSSFGLQDGSPVRERYEESAGDGIFRFSIGLESPEDIIADLTRVLGAK